MTAAKKPANDEIIALQTYYWDAMKAKDDACTSKLSATISFVSGAQGVTRITKRKIGEMPENRKLALESYAFEDVEGSTPDVAIVAYTVTQ